MDPILYIREGIKGFAIFASMLIVYAAFYFIH
jgi:hypothetical protein